MIDYKLKRSKRKTLALHITEQGLEVRAPLNMPLREIERFIQAKAGWIEKHLAAPGKVDGGFALGYGDSVLLRGALCPIIGSPEMKPQRSGEIRGRFMEGALHISENLSADDIRTILSFILRQEAKAHIPQRVAHYAAQMGLTPAGVRITTAFGRWGSCNAKKRLNFAWMLMMADDAAIDSVVVHELAHIAHPNHSAQFHQLVREHFPDYDERHKDLKALGRRIALEGWKG